MHVDFKITVWQRVDIDDLPNELRKEVTTKIMNGQITSVQDLCDECLDHEFYCKVLDETEEEMSPEENDGQSTIELYEEEGTYPLWTNEIVKK